MPPVVRTTTSEEIYQTLRSVILSLRYKPGEELDIQVLSAQLQVSRSPVRDALLRLSADNLVEIFPQKGTRVSLIDLKQVEEERFLRKSLEESAVKKFIHQAQDEQYIAMERAIEDQQRYANSEDFVRFLDADNQFHEIIFSTIGMQRIWRIINAQGGNHHRIRLLSFYETNVLSTIIEQHQSMVQACKARELDVLLGLEDKHLSKLLQETAIMVEHYPQYFKQENSFASLHVSQERNRQ